MGAICWLPRLDKWASTISNNLKTGGIFYMVEFHPVHILLSGYPYFHNVEGCVEEDGTYTENWDGTTEKEITWSHSLGDVINALVAAGIRIDHVQEYPFNPYDCSSGVVQEEREPGRFYVADFNHPAP